MKKMSYLAKYVLACLLISTITLASKSSPKCRNNEMLQQEVQQQWSTFGDKYYHLFEDDQLNGTNLPSCDKQDFSKTCPANETWQQTLQHPWRLRSLSPYDYCVNHHKRRFPSKIIQARCLCDNCVMHDRKLNPKTKSRPISVAMKVLQFPSVKKNEKSKKKSFKVKEIEVPVGCHCAMLF